MKKDSRDPLRVPALLEVKLVAIADFEVVASERLDLWVYVVGECRRRVDLISCIGG